MDASCLRDGWRAAVADSDFFEVLPSGLLLAFFVGAWIAPIVLWRYQNAVTTLMSAVAGAPSGVSTRFTEASRVRPIGETIDRENFEVKTLVSTAREGLRLSSSALIRAAVVFAVLSVLVATVAFRSLEAASSNSAHAWLESALYSLCLVGGVTAPLMIVYWNPRWKRLLLAVAAMPLLVIVLDELGLDAELSVNERVGYTIVGVAMVVFACLAISARRIRNVVPLITIWLSALFSAFIVLGFVLSVLESCEDSSAYLLAFFVVLYAGWRLIGWSVRRVDWVASAYEQQKFSDTQFQVGLWSIVVTMILVMQTGPDEYASVVSVWSVGYIAAWLVAVWVYLQRIRSIAVWSKPLPMLMLRVFSSDRRLQDLLDEISYRWSFLGPIYLVGGPDLAKAYLEPHELLLFLSKRLSQLFVLDAEDLDARFDALELQADPDGRYRVNEFFCHDDTWRMTVERLLAEVPLVLLDLRGFDRTRKGTAYELQMLAQTGALSRTVLLSDNSTDRDAITATLDPWGAQIDEDWLVHVDSPDAIERIMMQLLARVGAPDERATLESAR